MTAKIRVPATIAKLIANLHPDLKKRVRMVMETILAEPDVGKALKDELAGLLSYRVKRFRILYRLGPDKEVEIVTIGPRRYIYEETFRLISKGRGK